MSNDTSFTAIFKQFSVPTSLYFSVCVIAMVANSFVLVVIWKDPKKCLRTRAAMLITSLIISDLFVAFINFTRIIYECFLEKNFTMPNIRLIMVIGSYIVLMISFITIFLISVEHLLAITQPIKFKLLVTKKWMAVIILSNWVSCTIILSSVFHLPGNNELFQTLTACSVLLLIALPTIYARAFHSLRQQSKEMRAVDSVQKQSGKTKRISQQKNFLLTSAVLVLAYLLTCAPFTFHHYLKTSQNPNYNLRRENDMLGAFLWIALHLNIVLDPFLYCLRIPQYRKSCVALIRPACR